MQLPRIKSLHLAHAYMQKKSCSTENPIPGISRVQAQMRLPNVCNSQQCGLVQLVCNISSSGSQAALVDRDQTKILDVEGVPAKGDGFQD